MKGGIYMAIFYVLKRKIIYVCLIVGMISGCWWLGIEMAKEETVSAQESLKMYSGSFALMDGDTGRVLTGKDEAIPMANASTTKILTCIVTLENASLDDVVTVSAKAAAQPKVRYGIKEGEQYSLRELMYGLMLESYNDCAVAIAEHLAGSTEEFARMLNKKAKEIGCKDTYFITPNGLDAENEDGFHHTTAEDLCKMMTYCVWESPQKEKFLEITQTKSYGNFVNRNAFLDQMEGVLSGKTGFTAKAGYCYVAALEQNGERYTIALLACGWPNNKTYKWKDAKQLFSYGLENYEIKEVVFEGVSEEITVDGYINKPVFSKLNRGAILNVCVKEQEYRLLMSVKEQLRMEIEMNPEVELPIQENAVVGTCNIYVGEVKIDSIPVLASDSAGSWSWKEVLIVIIYQFLSVAS
jgi:D-alanyl-D-alanine carboxypeptidase (penicillin-binding protein 5/6)